MLLEGDFAQGFAEHEWRLRRHDYRQTFHVPRWQGEALPDGKIMVWAEQGLGDALHFIRYIPMVKERVGRVLLKCRAPLRALFATIPGIDQVIMPRTAVSYDVHAPLMSMPYIFETDAGSIPADVPYIPLPEPLAGAAGKRKVGLVWAGNPDHARDKLRSRPLTELEPLTAVKNVEFYGLQFGPAAEQVPPAGVRMTDLTPGIEDFLGTARAGGARFADYRRSLDRASRRRVGPAGVDHHRRDAGLAVAVGTYRFTLVSERGSLPLRRRLRPVVSENGGGSS